MNGTRQYGTSCGPSSGRPREVGGLAVIAAVCLVLCALASPAAPVLISVDTAGDPAAGSSGWNPLAIDVDLHPDGWGMCPADNDGTIVFLTEAPGLDDTQGSPGENSGTDWDTYRHVPGTGIRAASVADPIFFDKGQALELSARDGWLAETREPTLLNPVGLELWWRNAATQSARVQLLPSAQSLYHPHVAAGGQFLAVEATDLPDAEYGDTNAVRDIYRQTFDGTGTPASLARVSIREHIPNPVGSYAAADCLQPTVSSDGTRVAFLSADAAFAADDTNAAPDVFLWDSSRAEGDRIRRVTRRADGSELQNLVRWPRLSADGEHVVLATKDPGVTENDEQDADWDVFVFEADGGSAAEHISMTSAGQGGTGDSDQPDVSDNGRFVVFRSDATNFPTANGKTQIYLRDRTSGRLSCLSLTQGGDGADADCLGPAISPNGRYVTFSTSATNLADIPGNTQRHVYLVDRGTDYANVPPVAQPLYALCRRAETGDPSECALALQASDADAGPSALTYRLLSRPTAAEGSLFTPTGAACPDTFADTALPLLFRPVTDFIGPVQFTYEVDDGADVSDPAAVTIRVQGQANLVSLSDSALPGGEIQGDGDSPPTWSESEFSASGDGRWVAFVSEATNLTDNAAPAGGVYLRDTVNRRTWLLQAAAGFAGLAYPAVALDGTAVAYAGADGGAVRWRVLSSDGPADTWTELTVTDPLYLGLSGDGDHLAFQTDAALVAADTDGVADIYIWTPETGTVTCAGLGDGGTDIAVPCRFPWLSADGAHLAFATVTGSAPETRTILVRNRSTQTVTTLAEEDADNALAPEVSLSAQGRYAAWQFGAASAPSVQLFDLAESPGSELVAEFTDARAPRLCPGGRFLSFLTDDTALSLEDALPAPGGAVIHAYRYDIAAQTAMPLSRGATGYANQDTAAARLSSDGRLGVFASTATNLAGDATAAQDIFLTDIGTPSNTAPVALASTATLQNSPRVDVTLQVSDADGDDVACEIVTTPVYGTLGTPRFDAAVGGHVVEYALTENWTGEDTFSFRCRDAVGALSPTAVATVTVAKAGVTLVLQPGTNAVSIPLIPDAGWDAATLFADPNAGGTLYKQDVWRYDAEANLFAPTDSLGLGMGVFLTLRDDITQAVNLVIEGTPAADSTDMELNRGWNFVGGIGQGNTGAPADVGDTGAVLNSDSLQQWNGTAWVDDADGVLGRGAGQLIYLFRGGSVNLDLDTPP